MNKISTSIEQSKKLLELGVDINTADMCWSIGIPDLHLPTLLAYPITDCDKWENKIPAWSLSALMELIPNGEKNDENYVDTESHFDFYICTYRNCWDGCIHSEYSEENLLDAIFGMIRWLLENGKI